MESKKLIPPGSTLVNDPVVDRALKQTLPNQLQIEANKQQAVAFDRDFKPRGAVAFFALLIILGMVIWFGIYFLMLSRI